MDSFSPSPTWDVSNSRERYRKFCTSLLEVRQGPVSRLLECAPTRGQHTSGMDTTPSQRLPRPLWNTSWTSPGSWVRSAGPPASPLWAPTTACTPSPCLRPARPRRQGPASRLSSGRHPRRQWGRPAVPRRSRSWPCHSRHPDYWTSALISYSEHFVTHILNDLGPHQDIAGAPRALLLRGELPQLRVEVDPVDGVHGQAPRRLAVLVVVGHQDLHVCAVNQAALADGDHARLLRDKVPWLEHPRCIGLDGDGGSNLMHQRGLFENLAPWISVRELHFLLGLG